MRERVCVHCNRLVEPEDSRCPRCGAEFDADLGGSNLRDRLRSALGQMFDEEE